MKTEKTYLIDIFDKLHSIFCSIRDGLSVSVTNDCTKPIPVYFCDQQSTQIDPESVCLTNDGGITIINGWEVFDISTNPPTSKLYIGGIEVTGYSVVSCDKQMQYDYEKERICVDGETWTKWYVWDKTGDGTPSLVSVLWLDKNDLVVMPPDQTLINNIKCNQSCIPTISDAFGNDLSSLLPGTSFIITKPECCRINVITSAGSFTLIDGETYYGTDTFRCPITINSINIISGSCSLDKIHVISNFIG